MSDIKASGEIGDPVLYRGYKVEKTREWAYRTSSGVLYEWIFSPDDEDEAQIEHGTSLQNCIDEIDARLDDEEDQTANTSTV